MPDRIGPYTITRELGRGGMGVVHLARDTRLDRDVAIKALPPELASDPARLERFEREARTLAQLNHPNLAGIHGVEEQDGAKYLVLEYVEGETLAETLDRGPLPVDDAVELAVQIAAGVEAAHEAGVIHRDLKPGNIIITPDGQAKVLDFGLARVEEASSSSTGVMSDSPTLTSPAVQHSPTMPGVILGTAAYMSPEQARGRKVDKRTDIWSFGVVLYEMLVGASPFHGETVSDSIGAVLHKNLDLDRLPPGTLVNVRRVLERCLVRDKNLRFRDIGDVRLDLMNPVLQSVEQTSQRTLLPWTIAGAAMLLFMVTLALRITNSSTHRPTALPTVDFEIQIPRAGTRFSSAPSVAITSDGQSVAIQADDDGFDPIYVRHLNQGTLRRVETPWAEEPDLIRWTRDGRWLIVRKDSSSSGELWKVSPFGEAPKLISSLPNQGFIWADSVDYLGDDTLIVGLATAGLWTVPERGGRLKQYLEPAEKEILTQPRPVPGSDALLFLEINGGTLEMLQDGERRTLFDFQGGRLSQLEIAPDGTVLFSIFSGTYSRGTYKLDLDVDTLEVTGDPLLIFPVGDVDIADNGTLVVGSRLVSEPAMRDLVWVNPDGSISEIVASGLPNARDVSLSPDSSRVAVSLVSSASLGKDELDYDIAVIGLGNGSRYELREFTGNDYYPFWTADGDGIIYTTYNAGIRRTHQRPASGAGKPETIVERSMITRPSDDGRYLVSSIDQLCYRETGQSESSVFSENPSFNFDLSSQSTYLAYTPGEAGDGVLLQRFPEGGAVSTVTTMDASGLSWSDDDSKLYFWAEDAFWETPVDISGLQPSVGLPRQLFSAEDTGVVPSRIYGIGADGRFLMLLEPEDLPEKTESMPIRIIQGWMDGGTQSR